MPLLRLRTLALPKTPEDRDKAKIMAFLKTVPGWWWSTPRSRFGRAGIPDILGCFFGIFHAIEVKRFDRWENRDYGVTPTQQRTLDAITNNAGFTWVIDDEVKFQKFKAFIRAAWCIEDPEGWAAQNGEQE